ncbi:MAG: hypothetical protein WCL14_01805 [Bacteroidota bacterium]
MKVRKSKNIKLIGFLAIASLYVASCGRSEHYRHCVDKDGVVMPDSLCNCRDDNNNYRPGYGYGMSPFMWYYAGRSFGYGQSVYGGGYAPSPGVSYSSPGVSRGGFGSSSSGSGGHGSAGGAGE